MRCRVVAASLWPCPRFSRWVVDFLAILPAFVEPTSPPVPPAACRQTEPRPPTVSMRCRGVAASSWTCPRFARWVFVFRYPFCFRRADLSASTIRCIPTSWTRPPPVSKTCRSRSKFMNVPSVCSMGLRLSCYSSCFRKADLFACTARCMPITWIMTPYRLCEISYD